MPIDPPICCPTLRSAEARPDSCGVVPATAISVSGTKMLPIPTAIRSIGPSKPVRYVVWSLICDSQKSPAATSSGPIVMKGRGPNRPTKRATICAVMMIAAGRGHHPGGRPPGAQQGGPGGPALGRRPHAGGRDREPDCGRYGHEQDPPPGRKTCEQAPQKQPQGATSTSHCSVYTECPVA